MGKLAMWVALVALLGFCGTAPAGHRAARKAGAKENHKVVHQQIRAVLTADQRKTLNDAKGQGPAARKAAHQQVRASLTADQKAKIKEIRHSARPQAKHRGAGKGHGRHKNHAVS